jgi:hypothetical protein
MEMYILINEKKDLKYLHKKQKGNNYFKALVYDSISDQIIDKYGASKEFLSRIKDEIQLVIMKADNEDQLFIDILEHDIQSKYNQVTENSLREAVIWIEKSQGYKISTKEITVDEFYSYIEFITKQK